MTDKALERVQEKSITDKVFNRVVDLEIKGAVDLPDNYSVGNALKSAYFKLKDLKNKDNKPVLEFCSSESIANALLDMVVQGLNPAKEQCYFIPFGQDLQMMRSYLGTIAITKRLEGVKDVVAYAIYKEDLLEFGFDFITGKQVIKEYKPNIHKHKPEDIIGALALIIGYDEILYTEYMDIDQIRNAWNMGKMNGASKAHKNFKDQMVIKTVVNRACKKYWTTSDDSYLSASLQEAMNRTDREFEVELEKANTEEIPIDDDVIDGEFEEVKQRVDPETGEILEDGKLGQTKLEGVPF